MAPSSAWSPRSHCGSRAAVLIHPGVTMCDWGSRRLEMWLARDNEGSAEHLAGDDEGTLSMWAFFSRRLRMWLLLAIALPLTRALVHRLALAAERRDPSTRTAKALHQADSTVTAVSRRAARKAERRKAER
jgi:hypothetical protein